MDTEQAKGRTWNGYVCPGCRNVFRVAADFAGDEVMCPSCQETLRLPKKPADVPASSPALHQTSHAPEPLPDENQIPIDADQPLWRTLLTSPAGRKKLSLALGIPLLLIAVVLMLMPADESPGDLPTAAAPSSNPAPPASPDTAAPLPETDATPIADLIPEVLENDPLPEPPPPALPGAPDPALVAEVPAPPVVQVPAPVDPEHGLVQAIPADTPVAQPRAEAPTAAPATSGGTEDKPVTIHTVAKGDTLSRISSSYRVPIGEIRQANQMRNDTVQVGQKLRIPGAAPLPPSRPVVAENPKPAATRHHTVVRGDTLSGIARKYAVDPKDIKRANGMKSDVVRLGARLVIPPAAP